MKRRLKVTNESNRYGDYFAIREAKQDDVLGEIWEMVAWSNTRMEAEHYAVHVMRGELERNPNVQP
jgi:hypothetical protein